MNPYSGVRSFAFWWRVVGIRFVIAMVVMAVGLVVLVSGGDRSWFVGVLATVLALGVAFVVAIYVVHYRHSLREFRKKMGDPQATLHGDGVVVIHVLGRRFGYFSVVRRYRTLAVSRRLAHVLLKDPIRHHSAWQLYPQSQGISS